MDLSLTESQTMLQRTARDFLAKEVTGQRVRDLVASPDGFSRELWSQMAKLGWLGLPFPARYGGGGGSLTEVAVLMEEMGRVAFPSPYLATVVLGGMPLLWAGSESQKKELLSQVASGNLLLTMALLEPGGTYNAAGVKAPARRKGEAWSLSGTKLFVDYATVADLVLWPARTASGDDAAQGITLLRVPSKGRGMAVTPLRTIGGDKQCEVTLEGVCLAASAVVGEEGQGWPVVQRTLEAAAALLCAEMVGLAQRALDMTVSHVSHRSQFGRVLGQFQAVKHHCANMAMQVEGARLLTYEAVTRLGAGLPAAREVAAAKAFASEACREVTLTAHQLHGGVGYIIEYDLYLYTQRVKGLELKLGTPREHLQVVAEHMGLGPA